METYPLFSFASESRHYTVQEVTRELQQLIERYQPLQDVWVEGEISNFTAHKSGHWYFTLKDSAAQLRCVMFKGQNQRVRFEPSHGAQVLVHGRVTIYESKGDYQLYVDAMEPLGSGDLHQRFEILKAKLAAEGLFDAELKQPLPVFPLRIGIVTSPTAAAFQDVLNVLRRRFPIAHVILSPTLVQGETAAPQIIAALKRLNDCDDIDGILMVRGGGSIEDLWCFNDEALVRAVAQSRLPIVTGVGHEIDFTLVDFAADYRAPTPSAAAEVITPDIETLRDEVLQQRRHLSDLLGALTQDYRQQLSVQKRTLRHLSPEGRFQIEMQRVDDLGERLHRVIYRQWDKRRLELQQYQTRLIANSPQTILSRGYAIVSRVGDGKTVNRSIDAAPGTLLNIQLAEGQLKVTVKSRDDDKK